MAKLLQFPASKEPKTNTTVSGYTQYLFAALNTYTVMPRVDYLDGTFPPYEPHGDDAA